MKYVNLGCGTRFHPDWINMDVAPSSPAVLAADLSRGIPLPANDCDVVYHSHLLEHLRRADAATFMRECCRVLKPGGTVRVAVPDLEAMCRTYLQRLEAAMRGDPAAAHDRHWMVLELYDQAVREHWRSDMWLYLYGSAIPNEDFVRRRIGNFRPAGAATPGVPSEPQRSGPGLKARLARMVARVSQRGALLRALLIGRFRLSGEVHHWMYDRFSLAQLMLAAGFESPVTQTAESSRIPDWRRYGLDTEPDGSACKPDSLFMEATKPLTQGPFDSDRQKP